MSESQILLTRPTEKSQQLASLLNEHSITSCIQPMLALSAVAVEEAQLSMLKTADIVIFVSQDAVRYLSLLKISLNEHTQCFAVGKSTAEVVESLFDKPCTSPIVETSEGLLALPELNQVSASEVVLIKGQGGRAKIGKELNARGAVFQSLSVYERYASPALNNAMPEQWQQQSMKSVLLTSNASIDAFFSLTLDKKWLDELQFFVVSERCAHYLAQKNIAENKIINCQGADNRSIVAAVITWYKTEQSNAMEQEKDIMAKTTMSEQHGADNGQQLHAQPPTNKSGKGIAWLALLVSFASVGALGFGYTLYQNQQSALTTLAQDNQQLARQMTLAEQQITSMIAQNNALKTQLSEQVATAELALNEKIEQHLNLAIQQGPELNKEEVMSLYRMAEFKAFVEQDYLAAAAMLERLDTLLIGFSGTQQARTAIHQDIQALNSVQTVDIESMYLKLTGLIANSDHLPLNKVELPDEAEAITQEALSENVDDWQANLKRSWDLLVDDFIKVRKRTAPVEPLLRQEEQVLIRHQLRFFLTQAQTALVDNHAEILVNALAQADTVLMRYYDREQPSVQYLSEQLAVMQSLEINFVPALQLNSQQAIEELL